MKNRILLLQCLFLCPGLVFASAGSGFAGETVVEVRFRGNFTTPDAEMMQLAGIEIGKPVAEASFEDIRQRLLKTGRFERVEVLKRYRSLSSTDQVVLMVIVKEKQPIADKFMFMPILKGSDEYGFTYGLRSTAVNLIGLQERHSILLTWGGVRRAALESTFEMKNPIVDTLNLSVGVSRKKHPYYDIGDFRREVGAELKRRLKWFEVKAHAGWTGADFGPQSSDFVTVGTDFVIDTRQNINLPRDAFYAGVSWERLQFMDETAGLNRYTLDFRGYKGIVGQSILAGQFLHRTVDGRLPDFERPFLGGANTLRGYEPGILVGDNIAISSIEFRMPLNSPQAMYHTGIDVFFDSGAVYDYGISIGNADFKHGAGFGGFLLFMGFGLKVDLAYDMHDSVRVHFSTGFRF